MSINKTILITGGSKNLGEYLSKHFLDKKYEVICISKSSKSKLIKNNYLCDLSNEKKANTLLSKLKKKYDKIDFIISCAGSSKKTFKKFDRKNDWEYAFDNNFFCFSNLLNSYLNYFKNQKTKFIVISSIASNKITNAPITYSVAKSALNFYCQIKAKELAKFDIKLNIILPGNILMKKNNWSKKIKLNKLKVKKYIKKNVPLNKFCHPSQISQMCDYLFSSSGDNITGSKFVIDGGESL